MLEEYRFDNGPGFAIGIYRSGDVLYRNGFGIAEFEHGSLITPATRFHIASVSKHFTAFAIALLAKEGKLALEDDVRTHLPWLPEFGHTITVGDLVHHTSGLRDQWLLLNMSGQTFTDHLTQDEVIALVSRQKSLNFEPGTDYAYSNTGYTLLAEIVSSVTGVTFREYLDRAVFSPLDMDGSLFYDDVSEVLQNRAHSYREGESAGIWRHARLNYETVGATSMFTSVDDMLIWIDNFMRPVVGDASVIKDMTTAVRLADGRELKYGFGLRQEMIGGHEVWLHGGSDAAFRSLIAFVPAKAFAVVILANHPMDRAMLLRDLIDVYLNDGEPVARGEYPDEKAPDPGVLEALAGSYLTENDRMIRFVPDDGELYYEPLGEERTRVVHRDDGTFDLGFPDRYWAFFRIDGLEDGRVARIAKVGPTDPLTTPVYYERFTPRNDKAPPLQELAGRYYSEELDASYDLMTENGQLTGSFVLVSQVDDYVQVLQDRFDSGSRWMPTLEFRRNCKGVIDGFYVTRRRVNRLFFGKVGMEQALLCSGDGRGPDTN